MNILSFARIHWLSLFIIACLVAACHDDDQSNIAPADKETYYATTDSLALSPMEMADAISESPYWNVIYEVVPGSQTVVRQALRLLWKRRMSDMDALFQEEADNRADEVMYPWQVESYVYRYLSLSAKGEEIILSGRVSFPRSTRSTLPHQVQTLSIYHHHVLESNSNAPSNCLSPLLSRTLFNSAVIEPDYEGYGASAGRPHCGSSFDVLARQAMDGVMAALEVMRQHGVTLADDGYSTSWGVSLGAPPAMAFARYYDMQATARQRQAIRLNACYAAGGPFLIHRMLDYMDEHPDYNPLLMQQMLKFLNALPASELGGYAHYEFCPEWVMTTMVEYEGQQYTMYQFLQYVGSEMMLFHGLTDNPFNTLANIFASDMTTPDGHLDRSNPKMQVVMKLFEKLSNWSGWTPKTSVYMAHAEKDDQMPYSQAMELYEQLAARSNRIHFQTDKIHWIIQKTGLAHIIYSGQKVLQMSITERPEEMVDEE